VTTTDIGIKLFFTKKYDHLKNENMFLMSKKPFQVAIIAYAATSFVVYQLLSTTTPLVCDAYPQGAGSCNAGDQAGGSEHKTNGGDLFEGMGLTVSVNGVEAVGSSTIDIPAGKSSEVTVAGDGFRGISIRLDDGATIEPEDGNNDYKVNSLCVSPVSGITHTNNVNKVLANATITPTKSSGTIVMDIFAVLDEKDPFAFSTFSLNVASSTTSSTSSAPVESSTSSAPVESSKSSAPVESSKSSAPAGKQPQAMPVAAPTATPPGPAPAPVNAPAESNSVGHSIKSVHLLGYISGTVALLFLLPLV
jgi:hypothetical protein